MFALPRHSLLPPLRSGYELSPQPGFFSVVIPETANVTNMARNPSLETDTTGHNAMAGAIARSTLYQRRGAYSLRVTPGAGVNDGWYYDGFANTTTGQRYWASLDVWAEGGRPYKIYWATNAGAQLGSAISFKGAGRWQRVVVPWIETGGAARRLYLTKDNHANVRPFYIDGLSIVASDHPITYFDGDMIGLIPVFDDFYWMGGPHASPSVMAAGSAAGGRVVTLGQLGFRLTAIIGLGLSGIGNFFTPIATGGAFYQGTVIKDRSFTLLGRVDAPNWAELGMARASIIDALKPDRTSPQQPLLLLYTPADDCGNPTGETLEIPCVFEDDLGGNLNNVNGEDVGLTFRLYLPFVGREAGESGATLSYQQSVANAGRIIKRVNGLWSALQAGLGDTVLTILKLNDGTYAVGGLFVNAGGVANADYLARYDPVTDTFSAFNATPLSDYVTTLIKRPDGNVIVGGNFLNAGGFADADYACLLNVTTGAYSAFNATPLNNSVLTGVILPNGDAALGGNATNAGGDASADYLWRLNGVTGAYSSFNATPLGGAVRSLILSAENDVIVGGDFLNAGGDAAADLVCRMDASTFAFSALSTVSLAGALSVIALHRMPNGDVLIGGTFANGGGDANNDNITRSNGLYYYPLLTGLNGDVYALAALGLRETLVSGFFTVAGGLTLPDGAVAWNGSAFVYIDADLPGVPVVSAVATDHDDFILGYNTPGAATTAALTTITYSGRAKSKAYPVVKFTGPGTLYSLRNFTTGRAVYFNLTLLAGETATLDFSDPQNVTFISNVRGNLLGTILPGSTFDFFLQSGVNSISLFIAGTTTADTAAVMIWRNTTHSLDGAIY